MISSFLQIAQRLPDLAQRILRVLSVMAMRALWYQPCRVPLTHHSIVALDWCALNASHAVQIAASGGRTFRRRRRRLSGLARVRYFSKPRVADPPPRSSCHGLHNSTSFSAIPAGGRQVGSPTPRPLVIPPFWVFGRGAKTAFTAPTSRRMPLSVHRFRPHHAARSPRPVDLRTPAQILTAAARDDTHRTAGRRGLVQGDGGDHEPAMPTRSHGLAPAGRPTHKRAHRAASAEFEPNYDLRGRHLNRGLFHGVPNS